MAVHNKAYVRSKTWSKAIRKYHIDKDKAAGRWSLYYDNLHQYADNKIHCGCNLCRASGLSVSDRRKMEQFDSEIDDLMFDF